MVNLRRLTAFAAATAEHPATLAADHPTALESLLDEALGSARRHIPLSQRLRLTRQPTIYATAPAIALRRLVQLTHRPTAAEHALADHLTDPPQTEPTDAIAAAARAAALTTAAHRNLTLAPHAAAAIDHLHSALAQALHEHSPPPAATPAGTSTPSRPGARTAERIAPNLADLALAAWLLAPALNLPAPPELRITLRRLAACLAHTLTAQGIDFEPTLAPLVDELRAALHATAPTPAIHHQSAA